MTNTTVFNRVGRYEIHQQIGRGGMAAVFLATDTETNRKVALKLVSIETDRDGQQVLEAERWGAKLQEEFCRESRYVPVVYEYGTHGQYFYIAMEHLSGRNLSEVISEGPMAPARAVRVAVQLCEFLEAADSFERTLDGRTFNLLLHGDLKPRNIRVLDGAEDEIKVFDFGIAKALSLSRKVTRNDFGSIAYLSPERLESGEIDAQAEFWAVGVLLYEMISGVQPFRAADTRRLEQRIRTRQAPDTLDSGCPPSLQAIVAKLLAANVADRYASASAIREDLQRFAAGEPVHALGESRAPAVEDEAVTRRTHRAAVIAGIAIETKPHESAPADEITRRTTREQKQAVAPVVAAPPSPVQPRPPDPPLTATPAPAAPPVRMTFGRRLRRLARRALMVLAIMIVLNEIRIYVVANALAENVPQDLGGVVQMWNQHNALNGGLSLGIRPLERALRRQSLLLADRIFARYRTAGTTVYEREWRQARDALALAFISAPSSSRLEGALLYTDGQLSRINGEARIRDKQAPAAKESLTAAVTAFRKAAEVRPNWPDPFLGLMRAFIAMEDVERGADALAQAEKYGYAANGRDWALLGEGYMTRAAKLAESTELEPLNRAAEAYTQAIDQLNKAAGFGNVNQRLREAQRRLRDVQERIEKLSVPIDIEISQ
ncbi:MAG TPA: serine/threonine-protein kinase [Vicinamibacterales bacterium]